MKNPKCALCQPKFCGSIVKDETKLPAYCPMKNFPDLKESAAKKYRDPKNSLLFQKAAVTEKECYDLKLRREEGKVFPLSPRIREVAEFAHKIGARKLGLAFCSGLADEAARATAILEKHDLKITSAVCSCGAVDKTELGIPPEEKIGGPDNFEAACNPLFQAAVLNQVETDFNILIGLCVGHDMLFTQASEAPVTTLIVKDRFTGHNPVISLYSRYHKDIV